MNEGNVMKQVLLIPAPQAACKGCGGTIDRDEDPNGHVIVKTGEYTKRIFFLCVACCERKVHDDDFITDLAKRCAENAYAPEVTVIDPAGVANIVSIPGATVRLRR